MKSEFHRLLSANHLNYSLERLDSIMQSLAASGASLSFLERLPSELLHLIFGNITYLGRLHHPVCRTLRPYIERIRYREIRLDYPKFLQLCQSVKESPDLAEYVERVMLHPDGRSADTTDYRVEDEALVFGFFKSATNLKYLSPDVQYPRLQCRLMSLKFTNECYGSLEHLQLSFFTNSPSLLRHTRHLGSFKKLEELYVSFHEIGQELVFDEEEAFAFEDEAEELEVQHLQAITPGFIVKSLYLSGDLSGHNLPAFVARFRSLAELKLTVEDDPDYDEALPILQAVDPTALTSLAIASHEPSDWSEPDISVAHLVNIETLHIPSDSCTPDFITSLAKLTKLKTLGFDYPGTPDPVHIQSLLHHRTRPSLLKSLSFCTLVYFHFESDDNMSIEELRYQCGGDLDSIRPILPHWEEGWTLEDAKAIVALAKEANVELNAELRIAISMSEEYTILRDEHRLEGDDEEDWDTYGSEEDYDSEELEF